MNARNPSFAPLRVLHVVDSLETGGLERVVTDLAIAQLAAGHQPAVFSLNPTGGFRPVLDAARVPVIVGEKRGGYDLRVLRRLREAARDCDVVHAHNFVPNYYAATALLGRRRPVLVGTCHDMGTRLANRKLRLIYRASLLRTAGLAMVGNQVRDRFVAAGIVAAERATTVLNGIPAERFRPTPERRRAARAAPGLAPDAPVIGCVGRLVALKNHALLITILPALAAAHPGLKLVLLGAGELEGALREQARAAGLGERVLLAGQRSDVADLLPAFDVFALPSLTEGLSIALLEACASELTVVATAVGGNPEIIRDGQTGVLVPPADGPALQAALGALLADPDRRRTLGAAAGAWVRANASIDALRVAYDGFYHRAVA